MEKLQWASQQTRELKANNLFGISTCRYTRLFNQSGEDNSMKDHLAIFPHLDNSIFATIDLLKAHYLTLGFCVPSLLGDKWSGDKSLKYGLNLSKIAKLNPVIPIQFKLKGDSILKALAIMENGEPCRNIPVGFFNYYIQEGL